MRILAAGVAALALAGCGRDDEAPAQPSAVPAIAFASSRDGDFEIYTMRPDGSDVRQLTRNEETDDNEVRDGGPRWSPDGRWIAFTSTRDHGHGGAEKDELYVMRSDGTGQRRLTENEFAELAAGWTDDGEILFWRCTEGLARCELRTIDREGGEEQAVYETEDVVLRSAGPVRGEVYAAIVSRAAPDFTAGETTAIDVETGEGREVDEGVPSPDGEQRLITTDRDENGPCLFHDCTGHATELYVDERRLTKTTAVEADAAWSPAGKRIVFGRIWNDHGDDFELWVMNADGSCQTQLTDNGEWDWTPDWYGPPQSDRPRAC